MEICYLEVSTPLRKFFIFDHLMLEDLPVDLAFVQGKFIWFLFCKNENDFFFFLAFLCFPWKLADLFFNSLIGCLSGHTFVWSVFPPPHPVWVWGGGICASSGHLLFVVIADFGMLSLEQLPTRSVHVQYFISWWCGRKELSFSDNSPSDQSLALYVSTLSKMINHFEGNLYKL